MLIQIFAGIVIPEPLERKIMLDYPVAIKKSVGADLVNKNLRAHHPWICPWAIHVSLGLINVVGDLLAEIEDVMITKRPGLAFFRITEELDDDLDGSYHRKLHVFLEARQRIEARDKALLTAAQRAVGRSLMICHACGNLLERKNLNDEDERELFPFLPVPEVKRKAFSSNSFFMHVCMACALNDWEEKESTNITETTLAFKAQVDPFDNLEAWEDSHDEVMDEFDVAKPQTGDEDLVADEELSVVEDEEKVADGDTYITMYDIEVVNKLEERSKDMSKDNAYRIKGVVKRIRETSPDKRLVTIPDTWRDYCDDLAQKFPNFAEVVDFIRSQLALSAMSDGVLRLPGLLLVGNPGTGKTEFMLTLANDLKTKLEIIDISAAQTGIALTGSETYWSNTRTGVLFDTLVFGEIANPIIMLDEVDKARSDDAHKPLAALHQLLEPRQAKIFKDLSLTELVLDASHVMWMATANTLDTLEKPILDRFTVFNISDPSSEQMRVITATQYQRFIDNHPSGHVFEETMRSEVIDELCKYHPRKVRKMLEQSFGLAAYDGRNYIAVEDIRVSDTDSKKDRNLGIGFLSSVD
ncbi:AAA family ATPase [Methylobacter tundripaludum]|uniref:AAA family ATPase n=1 Tax=Methylobacter tundripaludum TaxID=173365 RepID=UPI0013777759|nr:AAA family ATPase [Methylobacter tundripaludum]